MGLQPIVSECAALTTYVEVDYIHHDSQLCLGLCSWSSTLVQAEFGNLFLQVATENGFPAGVPAVKSSLSRWSMKPLDSNCTRT